MRMVSGVNGVVWVRRILWVLRRRIGGITKIHMALLGLSDDELAVARVLGAWAL